MLVCPQCRKSVDMKDYASASVAGLDVVFALTNFIDCPHCDYYGLPIEVEYAKKGNNAAKGMPKARNKTKIRKQKRKK